MRLSHLLAISLPVLSAFAAPRPQEGTTTCVESFSRTLTRTVDDAMTVTNTYTHTVTASGSTSSTSSPTATPPPALTVISARSGSPIHLLPMNAAGQKFYLGGSPATYCPTSVGSSCPPGNVTAIAGLCAMDVLVPGGQQIYAAADGSIGYTQAHSAYIPAGSVVCPFTYDKDPESQFGHLNSTAFGATGLMACPTLQGGYQVFAAIQNATVPIGNVSECIGFDALTNAFQGIAAWQYT